MGNLTQDPELKQTQSGQSVARISVATNSKSKNKEGKIVDNAEYHSVVAWGKLAEISEKYLKKGSRVFFEGSLKTTAWKTKEGLEKTETRINANNLIMLDRASGESKS